MNWKKLENKIKKDIGDYKSSVDVKDIWASIDSDVSLLNKKRRRKKRTFWFWISTISLIVISSTIYLSYQNQGSLYNEKGTNNDVSSTSKLETPNTNDSENIKQNKRQEEKILTENKKKETSSNTENLHKNYSSLQNFENDDLKKGVNNSQNSTTNTKTKISKNDIDNNSIIPSKTPKNDLANIDNSVIISKNKPDDDSKIIIQNKPDDKNSNSDNISSDKKKKLIQNPDWANDNIVNNSDKKNNITQNTATKTNQQDTLSPKNLSLSKIDYLTINHINENTFDFTQYQTDINQVDIPNSKKLKHKFSFNLRLYGGVSQINKIVSSAQNTMQIDLELRRNTETVLEAIQAGFNFSVEHQSGFEIGLGLQKTVINERFDYQNISTTTETIEGIQFLREKLNGNIQELLGNVSSTRITNINKKIYNSYEFYEIPLTLTYQKQIGFWKLGLQAGILANLSLKTNGQIITSNFDFIDIDKQQDEVFKSKIGLGYSFGLSIKRRLSNRFSLSLNPTYHIYPKNIHVNSYPIQQQYKLFGANIGIIYRIK